MYSQVMTITPEIAAEMLKKNVKNNRKLSKDKVRIYAGMIENGNFKLTPQGISFSESGDLIDGQHRLSAIVMTGIPIEMYVTFDAPSECLPVLDRGSVRSIKDAMNIMGYDTKKEEVSIGGFLVRKEYHSAYKKSDDLLMKFLIENKESLRMTRDIICQGGANPICRTSSVAAGVWSAYIAGVSCKTLYRFCEVVNSGFYSDDSESSAIVFRKQYYELPNRASGDMDRLFCLVQEAIQSFDAKRPRRKGWSSPSAVYYIGNKPQEIVLNLK